jgi:hypothetical protein
MIGPTVNSVGYMAQFFAGWSVRLQPRVALKRLSVKRKRGAETPRSNLFRLVLGVG